ncbi:hypothetical protein BC941DRAFT_444650 [Chlamydoabsidia padenii]|nr:hypothetical protein BC941DRAFT_444650 [Chlamydoabsidia padenii]
MAIERAFGLLVVRMTIFFSCILHNICIDQNDIVPEAILQQEAAEDLQPHPPMSTAASTMNGMYETGTNMDVHADDSVSDLRDGIDRREQIRALMDRMVLD